jgi:UPF0755 protein
MPIVRKWLWISALSLFCAVAAAAATTALLWRDLNMPMPVPAQGVLFEVRAGVSLSRVSNELAAQGLVQRPRVLAWYARLRGDATRIHAGEYRIEPGLSPVQLIAKLVIGDVHLHQFTIVEGWRFGDLLSALRTHPAIVPGTASGAEIMSALGQADVHPEGQFLPDTYKFPKGTAELQLLTWAHEALQEKLSSAWDARALDAALANSYEALILASIVEKETALASERPVISGVFHRRLQRGMRLQTDPAVIYGLGENYDGNLRRQDLSTDTPYNTYTRRGLPPTPIALAGAAAIDAAVDPENGNALYFVATGETDGSHRFSATLEEHNRAVQDYLQRLRRRSE